MNNKKINFQKFDEPKKFIERNLTYENYLEKNQKTKLLL